LPDRLLVSVDQFSLLFRKVGAIISSTRVCIVSCVDQYVLVFEDQNESQLLSQHRSLLLKAMDRFGGLTLVDCLNGRSSPLLEMETTTVKAHFSSSQ